MLFGEVVFIFLRVFAFVLVLTAFKGYFTASSRLAVSLSLTLLIGGEQQFLEVSKSGTSSLALFVGKGLVEAIVGAFLALPICIAFESFRMAARCCDLFRGAQFAEQLYPDSVSTASVLENFSILLIYFFVFSSGAYQILIRVLERSFFLVPLQTCWPSLGPKFVDDLLALAGFSLEAALFIAAPVLVSTLVVDLLVLLYARMFTGANLHYEFLPLKMLLGFILLRNVFPGDALGSSWVLEPAVNVQKDIAFCG